jgi:hypothetical protein
MDAGRPLCLLPVTLLGRFQHHCLVTMDGPGAAGVAGLAGKRVGVRSWSQTTGVWVRGIMSDDHGLDVSQVEWVVYEGARWYARTGAIPLNHMVAATDSFVAANPGLVRELCGVLAGAVPATPRISSSPDFYPSGFAAVAAVKGDTNVRTRCRKTGGSAQQRPNEARRHRGRRCRRRAARGMQFGGVVGQ